MTDSANSPLQDILQMHLTLLETLRREEWEVLADISPAYSQAVEATIAHLHQSAEAGKKEELARLIASLQDSEAEIGRRLQARMQMLRENMLKLQQGKTGCRHYAEQMPRRFA
ncbi:TPA: flagellar protein FliT [Enterobacter kobei]|nr:flagellar protein FliT [Enterobacter kobei]